MFSAPFGPCGDILHVVVVAFFVLYRNKRARFGTATPAMDACLGYIDEYAEVFGQLMPHENATYLYLSSMKVKVTPAVRVAGLCSKS